MSSAPRFAYPRPSGPVRVAVLLDRRRRITGVVDEDLLRRDERADRRLVPDDVELAVRLDEFHQVDRREVARRVVQEHVLEHGFEA